MTPFLPLSEVVLPEPVRANGLAHSLRAPTRGNQGEAGLYRNARGVGVSVQEFRDARVACNSDVFHVFPMLSSNLLQQRFSRENFLWLHHEHK
jgi:hypothetical protein